MAHVSEILMKAPQAYHKKVYAMATTDMERENWGNSSTSHDGLSQEETSSIADFCCELFLLDNRSHLYEKNEAD